MLREIFQRPNGRGANAAINPASLALASWQAADYDDQQRHYVALREWYDGDHKVPLTDRQREYLGLNAGFPWSMNYLRLPVELCVERLTWSNGTPIADGRACRTNRPMMAQRG